jgi:hypothetical protein
MGLSKLKEVTKRQDDVKSWLQLINENDQACIDEVMNLMLDEPGYSDFITKYAQESIANRAYLK